TRSKRDWSSDVCSSDLALPGFVGAKLWRKRMLPDGSACKIRRSAAHPNNNECKEQQRGALRSCAVETNGEGERKCNQDEAAGARSEERRVGKEGRWGAG